MSELIAKRRICRNHDSILDGLTDLVVRADRASVLDLGCNRGLAGYALACNGARLVHGVDLAPDAVEVARGLFADLVECQGAFVVGDLTKGISVLEPFGNGQYDIILMLGTYHKLKRAPSKAYADLGARGMSHEELSEFMTALGTRTTHYFGFKGVMDAPVAPTLEEFAQLDADFGKAGLARVMTSLLSRSGPTAIWARR